MSLDPNQQMHSSEEQARRNRKAKWWLAGFAVMMVGFSFAIVPLYDIFCRVTGYGGTTQQASVMPDEVFDREVQIRFNADHARDLPWSFAPAQTEVRVKVGESGLEYDIVLGCLSVVLRCYSVPVHHCRSIHAEAQGRSQPVG